jgi:monofunctional glycosyltransferase
MELFDFMKRKFEIKSKKNIMKILKIAGFVIIGFHCQVIIWTAVFSFTYTYINPPKTSIMLYREFFYGYKTKPVKYVPLSKMQKYIPRLLVSVEDYTFYKHNGIDFEAIQEAMNNNKRIGTNMYGGSTLTQQLTRTLFLFPKKLFFRKYVEMIMALEVDFIMPKKRILELYLNYVEWGKGVYGIERASLTYYKKSIRNADYEECIRLLTILASPIKYNPDNFYKKPIMVYRYNFLCNL